MTGKPPVRRARAVTIRDVAKRARVSAAAVSRHFNQRIVLPEATVKRIETAASDLGYRPNVAARRLKTGSSESLGIVISDVAYPFFGAVASAAEAECARNGYSLLILNSRNIAENEIAFLQRIEDAQVDGVLLMTNHSGQDKLVETINRVKNVVLADEDVEGADASRLFARNFEGARMAVDHLIENGHTRIAFVGGDPGLLSTRERRRGWHDALTDAGLTPDPELELFPGYRIDSGEAAFAAFDAMDHPPTAIFAIADMIAIGLLRAFHAHGLRVPQAASLIGFDDTFLMDVLDPPMTTVRQSPEVFGTRGIQLLQQTVEGKLDAPVTEYVDVELVRRSSVGAPRQGRHWRDVGDSHPPGHPRQIPST
ncbi:MAG: LacI family transcriptional regulator [Rhodobacteraceae bacterium]|nr:LacI family transcriptional regulator [Paracoccaceae bacterium]MAY47439.1 LacI family transcriptional regulator [Paracoccaceae bacterium]